MKIWTLALMLAATSAVASPRLTFEGTLTDADGALLDGPATLTFSVYAAADGGLALWTETHPDVQVVDGDFYATLGDIEPLGDVFATTDARWIGLAVDGEDELSPRNPLTEVPRAAAALWAADVQGQHIHPSAISIGDTPVISAEGRWVGPGGVGGGRPDYEYHFASLTGTGLDFCGLLVDGPALCFGIRVPLPPDVRFTQVSAGAGYGCGIRDNREIVCWGASEQGQTAAPFGQYRLLSSTDAHSCALTTDSTLVCWGQGRNGATAAPAGRFTALCTHRNGGCAIAEGTGALACWGEVPPLPAGDGYEAVACNTQTVCATRPDGALECAGTLAHSPEGPYREVVLGTSHACGIKRDGHTVCWGPDGILAVGAAARYAGGPGLAHLALGDRISCGLRQDGTAFCWGGHPDYPIAVPQKAMP